MYHMIFISFLLIISSSDAEDYLKCSAVGKANEKCVKDFYPDQEAQETNIISAFEDQIRSAPQSFSSGQNPPSSQYSEQNQSIQGQEYDYGYTVHDETTGDQKTHKESRYDNVVHGSYSLIEPDGSRRTVVYTADDINGFNAVVYIDKSPDILNYNNIENRNTATFPAEQSENHIFHSSSHAIPVFDHSSFEKNGKTYSPAEEVPLKDFIRENPTEKLNPSLEHSLETTTFAPAAINLNSLPNIFHHHLSLQQNLPVVVDSFQTRGQEQYFSPEDLNSELHLLNQLDDGLVEQISDNSLMNQNEFSFVSTQSIADQINFESSEGTETHNIHRISGTAANPIVVRLLSENVRNFTTDSPNTQENPSDNRYAGIRTDAVSPNHIEEQVTVNTTTYLPMTSSIMSHNTTKNHERQTVSSGELHPTLVSGTSTVAEQPHQTAFFTTPVTATTISQQRLNSLSYGEFPLLAHVSPSYAGRYARHFV